VAEGIAPIVSVAMGAIPLPRWQHLKNLLMTTFL